MPRRSDDAYLDDEIEVPDGGSVRVNMMLMDHARSTDATAARTAAKNQRLVWVRSLTDAYKMTPGTPQRSASASSDVCQINDGRRPMLTADAARRLSNTAYREMVMKLQSAWRSPSRDAAEPDNSSSAEAMRRHLRAEEEDIAQARRDAAYKEYVRNLGAAWQQGRTDPSRAVEIEQRLERERGKYA
jgi:hypothetical protein